ncbi:MAG: acyl-CoA dehydrogenase [Proteobacteria bacterium]|nr:acyl-CoA dehydrogenase [Pseudomonadota bacterium]
MSKPNESFMRSLCMGKIAEDIIFPFPKMKAEEQETLKTVFSSFSSWLKGRDTEFRLWDKKGELPKEFIQEMKDFGLFSFIIPEEHGGLGLSATAYSRILQELSRYDSSMAITAGAHSSIGMKGLLLFGTVEQKEKYLPKLSSGEMIACFCLTEPSAGSDAAGIKSKAVKEGDAWVLNGEKIWITNGGLADFFTVFARTDTPEGQITAFIVTRDMAGVSTGPHEDKMGLRASSTVTVSFENVRIPAENVLGEVGKGFKIAMKILNSGRSGLGGGCIGGMKKAIALSTQQAKSRSQFGKTISEFGLIKQKLGHMVVDCYATEAVVSIVAGLVDQGSEDYAVEAAISKVFATECLWRTLDEALQIAGGGGYMTELPYERMVRDSRINRIYEGTNDILRLFIALTAMHDVGAQLKELAATVGSVFQEPIKGFGIFSDYAKKQMSLTTGIGKATFTKAHPSLKKETAVFEECAKGLAVFADRLLRKHGKKIVELQFPTRRLADAMIDLFALACVISRVTSAIDEKGLEKTVKEREILHVFSGQVGRRVRSNFGKIDDNDDQEIISLANHALELEGFAWDNL